MSFQLLFIHCISSYVFANSLESYDRNDNFRNVVPEPVSQPLAILWPSSGFRQLTHQTQKEIPEITADGIKEYFLLRIACDAQHTGDIQALHKGKLLLESHRVEVCSVLCSNEDSFFTGIVRAAMKKKVSYNVKLKVSSRTAEIMNSDCECPAGKGPHGTCKHVAALLGMLEVFTRTGDLLCRKSCTDKLQTFHHPHKAYDGSPLKMHTLRKRKRTNDNDDDPRPSKYRKWAGYGQFVNNLTTNYCFHSGKQVAFRYLNPKADLQAAMLEHDYTLLPFAEYWVDASNRVTATDIACIEQKTRRQALSHIWFTERAWRVTASRFGDVLKATYRRNMQKLCASMVFPQKLHCQSVVHGRRHEKAAVEKFMASTGHTVASCGLFVCEEYPFLAASPDGLVGLTHTVEVKCPLRGYGKKISANNRFPFLYFDTSDEQLHLKWNSKYYMQVQGQLGVTGREACYFVVYTGVDIFIEHIDFSAEYWLTCMVPRLQLFYDKHLRPFIAKCM